MIQYSGPNSQQVLDSYGFDWEHYLAAKGILVVCVDGRATGARGEAFRKCDYMKMGVIESQDQVEAAQALGKLPYVDKDRIAIWGWSFGGYNTLMAMSVGNGTFKAGIAVAPPTDWKFYDSIYTERYMRTPKENPQGYAETSPLKRAKDLQGKLLIVHGTADDNVHFQQTMDYVEELVQANKQFEMQVYNELINLGWTVETQVGVRGYRIDLAVYDEKLGVYLAGIECDGRTYHSSKSAFYRLFPLRPGFRRPLLMPRAGAGY